MALESVARGGSLRLFASYETEAGVRTEPVGPLVDLIDPLGVVAINDAVPLTDGAGLAHYDFAPGPTAPAGIWTARWSGTVAGAASVGEELFTVTEAALVVSLAPPRPPASIGRRPVILAWPFHLDETGQAVTVVQSSDAGRVQEVAALILTRLGERTMVPAFGTPDPAFAGVEASTIAAGASMFGPPVSKVTADVVEITDVASTVEVRFAEGLTGALA